MTVTASRKALARTLLASLASCLVGCSSTPTEAPDSGAPSDAGDAAASCLICSVDAPSDGPLYLRVQATLELVCGSTDGCHGAGAGNMGILPGSPFANLVGVTSSENPPMKRVLPGDPDHSYVYLKLACNGGIVGACMPLGMPSASTAQLFHDWIEAGAPTQ